MDGVHVVAFSHPYPYTNTCSYTDIDSWRRCIQPHVCAGGRVKVEVVYDAANDLHIADWQQGFFLTPQWRRIYRVRPCGLRVQGG
jgi:hypothetical protein